MREKELGRAEGEELGSSGGKEKEGEEGVGTSGQKDGGEVLSFYFYFPFFYSKAIFKTILKIT